MDAKDVIEALRLVPHPEGGHYRETWRDEGGTAIYFLLAAGEESAWHRVRDRAEIWHYYAGAPLELRTDRSTVLLGNELESGQRPQAAVAAGAWQSARTLGRWTLVGCTVAPPFAFEAFEMARQTDPL